MPGWDNAIVYSAGERLTPSSSADILRMQQAATDVASINHTGNPEGVVAANPSSLCHDPVSGSVYRKATGTGNTGWDLMDSETPIGQMTYFATANNETYPNPKWLKCDGSIVNQADYPTLFDRVGLLNHGGQVWTLQDIPISASSAVYGSLYVISASAGNIATSTDGITWTTSNIGTTSTIQVLGYVNSTYLAWSNGFVYRSNDTITWTASSATSMTICNGFAYGASIYVAVGDFISSSTDLITWTNRGRPPIRTGVASLNTVTFANGLFTTANSYTGICTSTDGISWFTPYPGATQCNFDYLNGIFLATGTAGRLFTSTNGISYKLIDATTTMSFYDQTYGGVYLICGSQGYLATSTDAFTWNQRTSGTTTAIFNVAYGNSTYLYTTSVAQAGTSTDGITWTSRSTSAGNQRANTLIFGNGIFVYVTGTTPAASRTSTDGITWASNTLSTLATPNCVIYDGVGLYVAGGSNGEVATSTDAITWTVRTTTTTATAIQSITYGAGIYVAVQASNNGKIYTSTDAITWTLSATVTLFGTPGAQKLIYASSKFYLLSDTLLYSSTDAITWSADNNHGNYNITSINSFVYQGGKYVYAGNQSIVTSTDAVTWSLVTGVNNGGSLSSILYGNGRYVISGFTQSQVNGSGISTANYYIATSTDAITWDYAQAASTLTMVSGAVSNDKFFYVGAGIMQTSPLDYIYNTSTQFQLPTQANSDGQFVQDFQTNLPKDVYIKAL